MISIELKSNPANLLMRPDLLHNNWRTSCDFVFVFVDHTPRKTALGPRSFRIRLTAPAGSVESRKLKPRRLRAEIVRDALKMARSRDGVPLSWKQADDAYLHVLKQDGCGRIWRTWRRVDLYLGGFARRLWRYWRVPPYDVKASEVPSEQVPQAEG